LLLTSASRKCPSRRRLGQNASRAGPRSPTVSSSN
jgi:hypothetical protein